MISLEQKKEGGKKDDVEQEMMNFAQGLCIGYR